MPTLPLPYQPVSQHASCPGLPGLGYNSLYQSPMAQYGQFCAVTQVPPPSLPGPTWEDVKPVISDATWAVLEAYLALHPHALTLLRYPHSLTCSLFLPHILKPSW